MKETKITYRCDVCNEIIPEEHIQLPYPVYLGDGRYQNTILDLCDYHASQICKLQKIDGIYTVIE